MRFALLLLVALLGTACTKKSDLPSDFLVDGSPIEPLCFDLSMEWNGEDDQSADLRNCVPQGYKREYDGPVRKDENGYYAYSYGDESDPEFPLHGWTAYKYIGKLDDRHAVLTLNNTGGTGYFSSLLLVSREDDTLTIHESLAGGDRCNGGIIDATIHDGKISIDQNFTPYDVLYAAARIDKKVPDDDESFSLEKSGVIAYETLPACAICCHAVGTMESGKLKRLSFDAANFPEPGAEDRKTLEETDGYALCLDDLVREYALQNTLVFEGDTIGSIFADFENRCLPDGEDMDPAPGPY